RALLEYIHEPVQKSIFLDQGFRDEEDRAGALAQDPGLSRDPQYTQIKAPSAAVAQAVLNLWNRVRKPANVLMVIDVSGSMSTIVPGTTKSRLQLAQEAARPVVDALAPTHQLGLWAFTRPPR